MPTNPGGINQNNTGSLVTPVPGHPSYVLIPSASFTRPADTTAYTIGDLVANSTTAGSVAPLSLTVTQVNGGTAMLRRCTLRKSGTGITGASFRVHVYNKVSAIVCANGDNGAWSTDSVASYLGSFDVTMDKAFTDGASGQGVPTSGIEMSVKIPAGATTLQCLLEARSAYTPASGEIFTLSFEDLQ